MHARCAWGNSLVASNLDLDFEIDFCFLGFQITPKTSIMLLGILVPNSANAWLPY